MMLNFLKQKLYQAYISKKYKVKFGDNVKINKYSFFEGYNAIFNNSEFTESTIGYGSYIANNSVIRKTKIGRFCAIGDNVRTCLGKHPANTFVSIHPAFFSLQKIAGFTFSDKQLFDEHEYLDNEKINVVEICNDVWIGNNVMIMDGIKIGDGAIIAGGSVVTKNVDPFSIVGGMPSKLIKYRFTSEEINFLLSFKWWNKELAWIRENAGLFSDIQKFYEKYNSGI
jgi:acetyltransferase-like isoleucine patch superfamily enzyme